MIMTVVNEIIVYIGGVRRNSIELEGKRDVMESRDYVDSREIEKVVSWRSICEYKCKKIYLL